MPKIPILPELPALLPAQKAKLIDVCNTYPNIDRILHYLETGELKFSEMRNLSMERKSILEKRYNEWVNAPEPPKPVDPEEVSWWNKIIESGDNYKSLNSHDLDILEQNIREYIKVFSVSMPGDNHVEEAKERLKKICEVKEEQEWIIVDTFSYVEIVKYLRNHPNTVFFADAEKSLWDIIESDPSNIDMVKSFLHDMDGFKAWYSTDVNVAASVDSHVEKAKDIIEQYNEWLDAKETCDIFIIADYLGNHPKSPFMQDVRNTLNSMKRDIFVQFKKNLSSLRYVDLFRRLIDLGVFSIDEFIDAGIVTHNSLRKITNSYTLEKIDTGRVFESSPVGSTDIFMFGIPSTGKTCILMGLLGSSFFDWNSQLYGGHYGVQLGKYLEAGKTPARTPNNFVSLVTGSIIDSNDENVSHPISLIDMAGEAFAEKIASNPDGTVSFEDMGIGATRLLCNDNDKVFFIVVDPTSEIVELNDVGITVNQKFTIKKLIDLFKLPENKKIMERVKAIHFIASKSDMLDIYGDRNEKARRTLRESYSTHLKSLAKICREGKYAINVLSSHLPKLYTFSLGNFYLGGVYDYDSSDSDKIIQLISNITVGKREKSFIGKVQDALNTKIL